jgi:hypothetical protein
MANVGRVIAGTVAAGACVLLLIQTREAARLRAQVRVLRQHQSESQEQIRRLQREQNYVADPGGEKGNGQQVDSTEVLRLRGQVAVLRQQLKELQNEEAKAGGPSMVNQVVRLGDRPKLQVNYDSSLWSSVSSNNAGSDSLQSVTWEFDATGTGWAQITLASHPDRIDELTYKQQILNRQKLRGEPAELLTETRELIGDRQWLILELRNGNTKPPRTELNYFLPTEDGYVTAFVVAEEASMPSYRENIEAFIRQVHVE